MNMLNEAASPQHADTSRVLSLMSVTSNKRSPHTRRCTCLTTSHTWQLEASEGGASTASTAEREYKWRLAALGGVSAPCSWRSHRTAGWRRSGSRWPAPTAPAPRTWTPRSSTSGPSVTRWWTRRSLLALEEQRQTQRTWCWWTQFSEPYSLHSPAA